MRAVEHRSSLPGEVVEFPSLKIPKPQLDVVLGSWLWVTLLRAKGLDQTISQSPFYLCRPGFLCDNTMSIQDRVKLQLKAVKIHLLALVLTQPRSAHTTSNHRFVSSCTFHPLLAEFGMGSSHHCHLPGCVWEGQVPHPMHQRLEDIRQERGMCRDTKTDTRKLCPARPGRQAGSSSPLLTACPRKAGCNCCFLAKPHSSGGQDYQPCRWHELKLRCN